MKIAVFIVTLIAFYSCDSLSQVEFNEIPDRKKPNLQNNDIVYFANQQDNNLRDTFIITRHDEEFAHDRFNIWERINMSYKNINKQANLQQIDIYLAGENNFQVLHYVLPGDNPAVNIKINGTSYSVVALKNESPATNNLPDSLYYSYKEGILRYCYSDSVFNRIK